MTKQLKAKIEFINSNLLIGKREVQVISLIGTEHKALEKQVAEVINNTVGSTCNDEGAIIKLCYIKEVSYDEINITPEPSEVTMDDGELFRFMQSNDVKIVEDDRVWESSTGELIENIQLVSINGIDFDGRTLKDAICTYISQ